MADLKQIKIGNTTYNIEPYTSYAKKDAGIYYVEGTSTLEGVWVGSNADITEYYDGLTILYKINKAGSSGGVTLNINGLGAKAVYRYGTTKVTTHHPVNSIIVLSYMADLNGGCWMVSHSYDSAGTSSDTKVTQNYSTLDGNYPILLSATEGVTSIESRGATTAILNNKIYANPYNPTITISDDQGTTVLGSSFLSTELSLGLTDYKINIEQDCLEIQYVDYD